MTKTEALQKAQIALLSGTAETEPLPPGEKGAGQKVKIVIIPKGGKRAGGGDEYEKRCGLSGRKRGSAL